MLYLGVLPGGGVYTGRKWGKKIDFIYGAAVRSFVPGTRSAVEEAVAPHTQCGNNRDGGFSSHILSEMPKCSVLCWTTEILNWGYLDSRALATG